MSTEPLACPYCNAFVSAAPGTPAGTRVNCSRCGEAFALRQCVPGTSVAAPEATSSQENRTATPAVPGVRRTVLAILAVMLLAAGIGFWFMCETYAFRWENNTNLTRPLESTPVRVALEALLMAAIIGAIYALVTEVFRRSEEPAISKSGHWRKLRAIFGIVITFGTVTIVYMPSFLQLLRPEGEQPLQRRFRRAAIRQGKPEPFPPAAVAPHRLAGLGFLPPDCDIVAAVSVTELRLTPLGKKLLDDPVKQGGREYRLTDLTRIVGLAPDQVDHVVVGLKVKDPLAVLLSAALVVRTKAPYDLPKIADALKAEKNVGKGKKVLYRFNFRNASVPALLWPADERTIVVSFSESLLEALPAKPREGVDHLPVSVRTALEKRVESSAAVWIVGHVDDWEKSAASLLLPRLPPEDRQRLTGLRTFALWVILDKDVSVRVALRGRDEAAASAVAGWLNQTADKAGVTLKSARAGDWLLIQYGTDAEGLRRLLER